MENKINNYLFGKIMINNQEFDYDIVLTKNKINKWWRKQSHNVEISDIEDFISKGKPDLVIFGTGESGIMEVPEETIEFIKEKGIKVIKQKTAESVKTFNKEKGNKMAFLHLTC